MNVISIQSQVAWGHVGNSAAVFPLQMHGIDVIAVPTTLLSNRPGYPTIRGRVLEAQLVADLLLGIEERGAIETSSMILSGYLGSPDIAAVVADFVIRAKARNPSLLYCCDTVLGDRDRGLFVQADIPPLVRDRLCPLADIITPNHFEFEVLGGAKAGTTADMIAQAQTLLGAVHRPSSSPAPNCGARLTARSRPSPSSGRKAGVCVRQSCRSARPAPAICLPRCSLPHAFRARTRRKHSDTPLPLFTPCWSAPRPGALRKCVSSRAPNNSCTQRAGSMPQRSGRSHPARRHSGAMRSIELRCAIAHLRISRFRVWC